MSKRPHTILVVGATGSVGRFVVAEALKQGYATRALVRNLDKAKTLPEGALAVVGDLTDAATLDRALAGTDAAVRTAPRSRPRPSTTARCARCSPPWAIVRCGSP